MRMTVNGDSVIEQTYATYDEVLEHYQRDQEERGREVPLYDPISLSVSLALFFVGQGIAYYYRRTAADAQAARHAEVLKRIEGIQNIADPASAIARLRELIREERLQITYTPETDAETELRDPVRDIVAGK